ncbi:MAG: metallophosphoesterase [Treponema sp.]|jgi:putative phosphoesterase|nr:metallophosphoesterase [Treponema sp.]
MITLRLLAISDTHGNIPALETVLTWARTQSIDAAVFLGDGIQDLPRAAAATGFFTEWEQVRGNNDYMSFIPEAVDFNFGGHRFFLCHGHRHNPYRDYNTLIAAAHEIEAEAVLFGHLHVPLLEKIDGILLVNPGSVGRPRSGTGATFAVIDCSPEKPLDIQFWKIDPPGKIVKLKM